MLGGSFTSPKQQRRENDTGNLCLSFFRDCPLPKMTAELFNGEELHSLRGTPFVICSNWAGRTGQLRMPEAPHRRPSRHWHCWKGHISRHAPRKALPVLIGPQNFLQLGANRSPDREKGADDVEHTTSTARPPTCCYHQGRQNRRSISALKFECCNGRFGLNE